MRVCRWAEDPDRDPRQNAGRAHGLADEIENRVGEYWNDGERQALTAVTRFTYNAAAEAPGLALLMEGYIAIVAQITGHKTTGAPDLKQIGARIAAGGFDDGAEWIEQLRTALKVFAR
jgi:hypothetical protein